MTNSVIALRTDGSLPTQVVEVVQDVVGAMFAGGGTAGVTVSYNDTAGTVTITGPGSGSAYTDEQARDAIGTALRAAGGSGLTVTVDDAGDTITLGISGIAQSQVTGLTTALGAKADLVGGVVPTGQLPSLALVTVVPLADAAARYALTSSQVQPGDIAVQASTGQTFMLKAADPSVPGNWQELPAIGKVQSVNGQQGVITLGAADVGAASTGALSTEVTRAQNAEQANTTAITNEANRAAAAELTKVPALPPLATVTAATALTANQTQPVDATSAAVTMTALPALSTLSIGAVYGLEKVDTTFNAVTVPFAGSDVTLVGSTSASLTMRGKLTLRVSPGAGGAGKVWEVVNHVRSDASLQTWGDVRYPLVLGQYELQPTYQMGHSWSASAGNATVGGRWWERLALRLRMGSSTNVAVGSRTIGDIANLALAGANSWVLRSKALATAVCTINDIAKFQGSAASRRGYGYAWRSLLATITASGAVASNTSTFVYSPGWTLESAVGTATSTVGATANSTGGVRWTTTTVGAYTQFTYTGTDCDVFAVARAAGAGVATIAVDGATVGTLDLTAATAQDCIAVYKIRGIASGNHTVTVTLTSGASLTIDSYRIPSTKPVPVVVLGEPPVIPAGTDVYANYQADLITFKADLKAIAAEYPTVTFVDLDQAGWDTSTMLATDGDGGKRHPNDKGCSWVAGKVISALAATPYLPGLNVVTTNTDYPGIYTPPAGPSVPSGGNDGTFVSGVTPGSPSTSVYANPFTGAATGLGAIDSTNLADPDSAWQLDGSTGAVMGKRPGSGSVNYWLLNKTADAASAKQSVVLNTTVGAVTSTASVAHLVICAANIPAAGADPTSFYYSTYDTANSRWVIVRVVSGVETTVATYNAATPTGTPKAEFYQKAVNPGAGTCTVALALADVDVATFIDSAALTGRFVGIKGRRNTSTGASPAVTNFVHKVYT